MKKISFKSMSRWGLAFAVLCLGIPALLAAGCGGGSPTLPPVSTLTRPMAMAVAVIPVNPTPSELEIASVNPDSYLSCLAKERRAFGFVANSGNDSVARIDLCTGLVESTKTKGNPFIVSHIRVGHFPQDVAVSLDEHNSRVFVANSGETSLSVIVSREGRTLQEKVALSGKPDRVLVAPSSQIPEGDVYVTLPDLAKVVRVTRQGEGDRERWVETDGVLLTGALATHPLLGGMALDPAGDRIYVADLASDHFYIIDLSTFGYPPRTRNVHGPQRDCSVSPDGRFLYLPRVDQRRVAVYDLVEDRYVDTNADLPSHFNAPLPGPGVDYDIELQTIPRTVVFANVPKLIDVPEPPDDITDGDEPDGDEPDGDEPDGDESDGDEPDGDESDGDESDGDETDGDETDGDETDEEDATARTRARLVAPCEDGDEDCEETPETDGDSEEDADGDGEADEDDLVELPRSLYAYAIGFNGNVQVIDVHRNFHKLFDTSPDNPPQLGLIRRDELEVDNGLCLADIDVELTRGRTPDARWELRYNGIVPESDTSVSGRFEGAGRFHDPNMDFTTLVGLLPASAIADPDAPGAPQPDWLEILSRPAASGDKKLGCIEEVIDEEGNTRVLELQTVKLAILEVAADHLVVDTRGIDLSRCFNTPVAYQIRAADNYMVYMTRLDSAGNRLEAPAYRGRAVNTPFRPGQKVRGEDQLVSFAFSRDDWRSFVCTFETQSATGDQAKEYVFRADLLLENGDVVRGIRCLNALDDGDEYWMSFTNDEISFAVCQDDTSEDIRLKQQGTFSYAFRTISGINEILLETTEGTVNRFVGRNPESALVMTAYPDYPRLYVVDSSEEIIYVIDLTTDRVVAIIQ